VRTVRSHGIEVLLFRPGKSELWIHGIDLMRPDGLDRVAQSAYEAASKTLRTERFRSILAGRAA